MNQRQRVAVVGLGVGKQHIAAFQQLVGQFEVVAVCDVDVDKARTVAADYNVARVATTMAQLCRMDDLDVIDICTPPHLHLAQIQQVLAAGKHAICEKPLVGSLRDVDELIRVEAESDTRVMPIFQYRFGHGLQRLRYLVDVGLAGRAYVTTVETAWRRRADYYAVPWRGKWKTELGGTLLSHASHTLDMLCYILGPVKSVFARTATRVNPIEVEDCASVSLEMADGSLASLTATLGSTLQISRHRFCFSGLTAESNTEPYDNSKDPWTFTGDSPELDQRIEAALARFVPLPERFVGQFYRFYQALVHDTELPVTLHDARASLELVTAMYHSSFTRQVVDLPIGPDHARYASWLP
jgi:predicted dehydrogenase